MADDDTTPAPIASRDLRTVTTRLVDLQRKCRSAASRSNEAMEMEQRIASVLDRLQPETADDEVPVPFAALARELYAVERFFESNGFLSIAKEVAHVERTLQEMAPPDEVGAVTPPAEPAAPTAGDLDIRDGDDAVLDEARPSPWTVPRPVAVVFALFVIAVVACIVIVLNHERLLGGDIEPVAEATPLPTATVPAPTPTPARPRDGSGPPPGAVLAEAIGRARLALADNDIEAAMDHLSRAALVDPDHGSVLATAGQIIERLIDNADAAADAGLWEIAQLTLARADRVATRFGLDATAIDRAARRHARMDRFALVDPADTSAVRAAAGRRVTVHFKDGSTRDSVIKGIDGRRLLLDEDTEVRGGAVYYTDEIPLADIDFLKVWEN
jgi:hypothetical protein